MCVFSFKTLRENESNLRSVLRGGWFIFTFWLVTVKFIALNRLLTTYTFSHCYDILIIFFVKSYEKQKCQYRIHIIRSINTSNISDIEKKLYQL